jgi:hypothetical protein
MLTKECDNMPKRTYFDPDLDYAAAIKEALAEGDITNLGALARQRELKIASDPAKYGNVTPTADLLGDYAYLMDTNPAMEDYGIAVNKARNNYVEPQYDTQPQTDPYADMLAEIERRQRELAEAQRQSRIAALSKQKEQALSSLQAEEAALKPYYYDLRNRTAAQSDIAAKNFAEYMAAQGIRGSAAGLPEIYRQSALQGQLGTLSRQEAADIADIARRRSGIESAYESDVAAAMADIDAQTLQNYIDNMRIIQAQRIADLAAQGKTSTGELTLQGREAQQNELARQAALLAARYYDDIQAYINTLDPNDPLVPYLYAERRKKIQAEAEKAAAAAAAASEEEQRAWKRAFDLFQSTGRITSAEQAQILGLPMDATVADVDIARMNAQTSRMNAETARMNALKSGQATEEPEPGSIGSLLGAKGVLNEARARKEEDESDIAVIDYVVKSGLPIEDISAVLSALGYTNEDIDMYEAATRGTTYMGEFQRWFNR